MHTESRALLTAVLISMTCHLVLFAVIVLSPGHTARKRLAPSIINVSMVTLPAQGRKPQAAPAAEKKVADVVVPEKEPVPVEAQRQPPRAEPEVSIASPEAKAKTSLKKKTFKPAKVVKSAIREIEKTVEETRPDPLASALERLKSSVAKDEAEKQRAAESQEAAGGETPATEGTQAGLGGREVADLIDIYRIEIAYQVQKNWAFSEQLAGKRDHLQASLVFKVMPDGQIKDLFFTDRSGNEYLDDSAYKAVVKSNPVAPHPPGIAKPFVHVGLRFTPEGVK